MSQETKQMFENMPDEETIASNLFSFSGDLYQQSDIVRFLEIAQYGKVTSMRFVAWLAALRVIEPDRIKWMPDIIRAATYYDRCVKRYFKTSYYEPLTTVNDGPKIRAAIEKNMEWFKSLAKYEEFNDQILEDAELRIGRMMATCYIDNPNASYDFDDERIFMITYIVSLGFARRGTLTNYFAEAFAYQMGTVLLSALSTQRKIMKLGVDDDYNADYLHLIKRFTNHMDKVMLKAEVDPSAIGRYYVYTMFTDAFEPAQLFCVFDRIVLDLASYRHVANYILVAMLRQIEKNGGRFETERIIPDVPYDAIQIVDELEALPNIKEVNYFKMILENSCPCINGFNILFGGKRL